MKSRTSAPFPYRVFGIGMNKTGTSSLGRALGLLGVVPVASQKHLHQAGVIEALFDRGDREPALRYARQYRGFEDRPWNVWDMYRRLDERYPGSRFILTTRDAANWWRSVHRWITVSKPHVAERYRVHLDAASLSEADMVAAYERYNGERCEYFRGRTDFLVLDIEAGNGWEPLCAFLDRPPVTDRPFPHQNPQRYDATDHKWVRRIKSARRSLAAPRETPRRRRPLAALSGRRCAECGADLPVGAEGSREGLVARMPVWLKRGYRMLQRMAFVPSASQSRTAERVKAIRKAYPALDLGELAAISVFFNPGGYRSRVENYRAFREAFAASGVPLLIVELAFGSDPFMLESGVAAPPEDQLLLRTDHVMWQKERLLNLGIRRLLDRGFKKIVWLDADVVFEEPVHWPWFVAAELERSPVCQIFGQVLVDYFRGEPSRPGVSAARYFADTGARVHLDRRRPTWGRPFGYPMGFSGFGWAARAEVLEQVPLYDRAVVGGGDKLIQVASHPFQENPEKMLWKMVHTGRPCKSCGHVNEAPAYARDYQEWAVRWNKACEARAGWTDLTIRSLFHGELRNRSYIHRRDILLRHQFDPSSDLAVDRNGCWKWASPKPALHLDVANYFFERREDA